MSLLKGIQLGTYLIGAPGAAGIAAHFLSENYKHLMNFDGQFYIVKAVNKLYDSGIPVIPEDIKSKVEEIVKKLTPSTSSVRSRRRRSAPDSTTQQEVFKDKKYWCRYFDYSRGSEHVIMQYDRNCVIYNIFNVSGSNDAVLGTQVSSSSTTINNNKEAKTYDIKDISKKHTELESLKLQNNKDYVQGAFYLLSIDKSKITRINTLTHIELTEPGTERFAESIYQKKITTLSIKAPLRGNGKDISLEFINDKLPSSMFLLKKVENNTTISTSSSSSTSGSPGGGKGNNKTYLFKKISVDVNDKEEKLQVLSLWKFPPVDQEKADPTKLDFRLLDKVDYDNIDSHKTGLLSLEGILSIIRAGSQSTQQKEKYFLSKALSGFWNYKVGDKIKLIEETFQPSTTSTVSTGTTDSSTQTTTKEIAEFEIISGLLVHLNYPLKCIPNSKTTAGFLLNYGYKSEYASSGNQKVYSERDNPNYCKSKDDIPPYTVIYLGTDKDALVKNSKNN